MIEMIKKLFGKKKEQPDVPNPPGRTFNRVLTGRYFGLEDENADRDAIAKAKQEKIDQIKELKLVPMFKRYTYASKKKKDFNAEKNHPTSVHVAFQKEVFAENWNMVHVTEISFTVLYADFEEFEKMAGVSLHNDFRDLSSTTFNGKERRKEKREV
ncbi:hypothetical protein MN086_06130 [Sulfurovum sp. XGS-02]|uniref:hypothetical protein n=1 Tax=Sulfurovum sp. XGS-02 TaxID=2925411 RepID=UPI00205487BC|nr:hypothetical protein [Sulfurovum sp. XGS-02]UPT76632.1 hypothetical protein MN086_06130 [Sulfurovum sp. XGS-02]